MTSTIFQAHEATKALNEWQKQAISSVAIEAFTLFFDVIKRSKVPDDMDAGVKAAQLAAYYHFSKSLAKKEIGTT